MKILTRRLRALERHFLPDESWLSELRRMTELMESRERRLAEQEGRPYVPLSERTRESHQDWQVERLRQAIEGIYAAKQRRR